VRIPLNPNEIRTAPACPGEELMDLALADGAVSPRLAAVAEHLLQCGDCLAEFQRIADDLAVIAALDSARGPRSEGVGPRFVIRAGELLSAWGVFRALRPAAAFRSIEAPAILLSDIIPVDSSYVLLELTTENGRLRLRLENGAKNHALVDISLYINDQIVEKSQLGVRLDWDLSGLEPGEYRIAFNHQKVLHFQIQE
jgi:hypothetical protein